MHRNLLIADTPPASAKNLHCLVSSHLSMVPTIVIKNAFFSDGPTDYSLAFGSCRALYPKATPHSMGEGQPPVATGGREWPCGHSIIIVY